MNIITFILQRQDQSNLTVLACNMIAQILEKSDLVALSTMETRPFSQAQFLGIQSRIQNQFQSKIKNLELKLQKKNQLVKYLQKKCGNQIIKSTKKLQDKINELQGQNCRLKKIIEFFGFNNDKKKSILTLNSQINQQGGKNRFEAHIQNLRNDNTINLNCYRQDFLNMNIQQLKQIVILQALEIKNFYKQNQISTRSSHKNKSKKKQSFRTHSKKNSMFLSLTLTQTSLKDSNQNLNNANLVALKDTTNINLNSNNITLNINEMQKKSSPNLVSLGSHRTIYESKQIATQTQTKNTTDQNIQTESESLNLEVSIQTQATQIQDCQIQTQQTMQEIQEMLRYVQILKIQNKDLLNQIQETKIQNNGLKSQVSSFSQKIQDYCNQLLRQSHQFSQEFQRNQSNNFSNLMLITLDSYNQVLQIFGLQPITSDKIQKSLQKVQKKLINQICNMKLQISQIVKQFRRVQRQLHDNFCQKLGLQSEVKWLNARLHQLQKEKSQIGQLLQNYNQQIMRLSHKQVYWRLMYKENSGYQKYNNGDQNCQTILYSSQQQVRST